MLAPVITYDHCYSGCAGRVSVEARQECMFGRWRVVRLGVMSSDMPEVGSSQALVAHQGCSLLLVQTISLPRAPHGSGLATHRGGLGIRQVAKFKLLARAYQVRPHSVSTSVRMT